jgi:hypothetical protein
MPAVEASPRRLLPHAHGGWWIHISALKDLGITVDGVRQPRLNDKETMGRKGVWTPAQSVQFLRYHTDHRFVTGQVPLIR